MKLRALLAAAITAFALTSCSGEPQSAAQVCVDPTTNMRVDDSLCQPTYPVHSYLWWYITPGYTIPAYGYPVAYGYAHPPRHYTVRSAPSSGGVIPKRNRNNQQPQSVQPTSASTQAPVQKKRVWVQSKPAPQSQPRTQPKAQSKPQWRNYKPPASRPAPPRPPTYTRYR